MTRLSRIEDELQGGEPLLAVNDGKPRWFTRLVTKLLHDNGTEKVTGWFVLLWLTVAPVQHGDRHTPDVIPQGLPLVPLRPHVGTLKGRESHSRRWCRTDL